jgi:DNA invertase Pin-like site-specific DNA recombinase
MKKLIGAQDRAVGYIRCSKDEQENSPEAQRAELAKWCLAHGVALLAVFEEIGVSGAAPLDKRLVLMDAVESLKASGAGVLLVAKRDRLARDVVVAAMIERLVERSGARVLSANGAGNEDGPEGLLMKTLLDAFAQYERALIRARTRAALAVKKSKGERTGDIPFGFKLAEDGVHLQEDQGEQMALFDIRRYRAEGFSLREIAAKLDATQVPARGARWHKTTVERILKKAA